jgi:Asp-tRNA(Asn)/Glu-tRNA(Gln) amidotransferase A subunit family amidase
LTRATLPELVAELNDGRITSEQLLAIFGERACTIGIKNCIITDEYFEYALRRAKECDLERRNTKKRNWTMDDEWDMEKYFPPLFGIPCSVKDNIDMEGTHSTVGVTVRVQ